MSKNGAIPSGPWVGPVVSLLGFCNDDASSHPVEVYNFYSVKLFEKNGNKRREAGDGNSAIPRLPSTL